MNTTNINNTPIVSSINDDDYLQLTTTGGSLRRAKTSIIVNKAKSGAITSVEASLLDKLTDGCFIMYHRKSDNYPVAVKASAWTALQSSGEIADGVLVISGSRHVVVAPTQAAELLYWSSSNVTVDSSKFITDRTACFADFDGKAKTAAILANATIGGDGSGYAPGFCAAYSRSNGVTYTGDAASNNNYGMKAGTWWLPSIGEQLLIWQNKQKVNACLDLITGATRLTEDAYWTSSETSQYNAWRLNVSNGDMNNNTKSSTLRWVRAVSAFLR